jgi:polysaccharide export outer membrane protein
MGVSCRWGRRLAEDTTMKKVIAGKMMLAVVCIAAIALGGCAYDPVLNLRAQTYTPDVNRRIESWMPPPLPPGGQVLRKGDRIVVYLKGIPKEEEIKTTINDLGEITLSLIKSVQIEGLTWPEAQKKIQKKYIEGEFYKDLTVIVVGQEGEYYVDGEVGRRGEYLLAGEIHLTQAIAKAGGFTDWANKKKVKVIRGQDFKVYDCEKIEKAEAEDPLIKTGDKIIVPRDSMPWGN